MKYGLYYYKNTIVLGDDFWAYAQSRFYPHIDYLIDNTSIYKFKSDSNEDVATIISAFVEPYNHEWTFLPPANIKPLFIGSYFRSTMWEFINDNKIVQDYLKYNQPIGVRSKSNLEKLRGLGIDSYFSGCITLTIPPFEKEDGNYICCVDVPDHVVDYIQSKIGNAYEIKKLSHEIWNWPQDNQEEFRNKTIEQRFQLVEEYLHIYANAHCVITTKLHCALPCLTQNTPVLFVYPENGLGIVDINERVKDFFDLLYVNTFEEFEKNAVDYDFINPPENKENWKIYKDEVEQVITQFINKCENNEMTDNNKISEKDRLEALVDILENKVIQLKKVVDIKNDIIRRNN